MSKVYRIVFVDNSLCHDIFAFTRSGLYRPKYSLTAGILTNSFINRGFIYGSGPLPRSQLKGHWIRCKSCFLKMEGSNEMRCCCWEAAFSHGCVDECTKNKNPFSFFPILETPGCPIALHLTFLYRMNGGFRSCVFYFLTVTPGRSYQFVHA